MLTQYLVKANKESISRKNLAPPVEKFQFLVLARNMIMPQHLINHFSLHYLSNGLLREVKNKQNFQICGRLREVVACKRQKYGNLTGKLLVY